MYLYGGLPKPVAVGILCLFALYLGLYHALFSIIVVCIRRSRLGIPGALVFAPFAWVAIELARSRITGFPWDLLGNALVDNLLVIRLAPFAGVMSISFLVVAINASLTSYFFLKGLGRILIPGSAILAAVALQLFGNIPFSRNQLEESATRRAILMQENLEVGAPGREVKPLSQAQELDEFTSWSLHPLLQLQTAGSTAAWLPTTGTVHPDIILWPEAPSHLISSEMVMRTRIGSLARTANSPVAVGSLGVEFDTSSPRGYYLYDSATLFDTQGNYRGRYDKIHLVPWGEYIPFKQFFSFAHKLTEGVGDMDRGRERTVFSTGGHNYGIFVCYESIFGDEVRQFVRNGAQVLVNISDDGWYGDTGAPWQHLNMTRMRAIENHRWLLLDTNTGITTAIDPLGRMAFQAPRHTRAAFVFPFDFNTGITFYTRHGDWFAWLCCLVTAVALGFGLNLKLRLRLN
jgi:apolipoprotein N-acyltransferase